MRDLAGDSFPIGDDDVGEISEFANIRRDVTGHVLRTEGFFEGGVDGTGAEADFGYPASVAVAGNAVPVVAAVCAGPGVEYAVVSVPES